MTAVTAVLGVVGAIAGAAGARAEGRAQAAESRYRAQVAANNRVIAEQNAVYEREKGKADADIQNLETRNVLGAQRSAQAGSGFDLNFGTNVRVRETAAALGALDAETIKNNAERRASDYLAQASNFGAEQGLQLMAARNQVRAGNLRAFTTLIGGASSVANSFSRAASGGGGWGIMS